MDIEDEIILENPSNTIFICTESMIWLNFMDIELQGGSQPHLSGLGLVFAIYFEYPTGTLGAP